MICHECDGTGQDREDIGDPCFACDGSGAVCSVCGDGIDRLGDYPRAKCEHCTAKDSPAPTQDEE